MVNEHTPINFFFNKFYVLQKIEIIIISNTNKLKQKINEILSILDYFLNKI